MRFAAGPRLGPSPNTVTRAPWYLQGFRPEKAVQKGRLRRRHCSSSRGNGRHAGTARRAGEIRRYDGMEERAVLMALPTLMMPPPSAITWTPVHRPLSSAVTDTNPRTYELLHVGPAQDPVDFGLEWPQPVQIGSVRADFACLGGRSFEPDPRATRVEAWLSGRWQPVQADLTIDARRSGELAPLQGRGTVRWTFRFAPVMATRVRVYAGAPAHRDLSYQCIALVELAASPDGTARPLGRIEVLGDRSDHPHALEPGANLATAEAGAIVSSPQPWTVTWKRPVMVSAVRVPSPAKIVSVEWAGSGIWRPVESMEPAGQNGVTFTPVCVTSLRVHADRLITGRVHVTCGPEAAHYSEAVRLARTDLLGERFRSLARADLAAMDSLLHPIDFAKTAIGRPADLVETMVTWTGTFLQMVSEPCKDPNTGADLPAQAVDRWVAPAPGGRAPDWFRTRSAYLEGWMPAVVTTYDQGPLQIGQTVFVTAPGAPVYGSVALIRLHNTDTKPRVARFTYALGRRRIYGDPPVPFVSDPLDTGYRMDPDRRTVRNASGEIVLHALQPATWGGTDRERHLSWSVSLAPRETQWLSVFVPDVTEPLRDAGAVAHLNPMALLDDFRKYWTDLMAQAGEIETPEKRLNDAARNLLAQCMIIGLDGDAARYGAYHYEAYFGLEEGWPAVALAQFGLGQYARRIMDYMLSPSCLDKGNYHHQYRNGLAPWYAADVARLAPDEEWLHRIAPTLKACAEWTIARIEENKDPRWGGILPRHAYGGDIGMPAFSVYANATCWRGLHDTAIIMARLGEDDAARRYSEAARQYRSRLIELADSLVDRTSVPPFLPMSFGLIHDGTEREKEPSYATLANDVAYSDIWNYLGNYWNLFAPCFQELRLFPVSDPRSRWVPDYMEARGGVLAGQVRFANGLDAVYGKGYIQSLLDQGRREEFATSLYGLFSSAMSRDLFSGPEVSGVFPLRTDNVAIWREHARERWFWSYRYGGAWAQGWQNQEGEPLAAVAGMALQLLRSALVRENYAEDPPQDLRLLDGAPRHWFEPGKRIVARRMATFFGVVSFEVKARPGGAGATIRFEPGFSARRVIIRLPSPDGRPIRTATVSARPLEPISGDELALENPSGTVEVSVEHSH